jgi:hypothetical protein
MIVRKVWIQDQDTINAWRAAFGLTPMHFKLFTGGDGFMAVGSRPLAACWLYTTPSGMGMLEGLIADPAAEPAEKSAALDEVVKEAMATAQSDGCVMLFGVSTLPAVVDRAKRHGFEIIKQNATMFACKL